MMNAIEFKKIIENNFTTTTKELNDVWEYIVARYEMENITNEDDLCEIYDCTLNTLYS